MTQVPKGQGPVRNLDLEKFRVQYGLTISEACEAFGLQRARWTALQKKPGDLLEDIAVVMDLLGYQKTPASIPVKRVTDVRAFMQELGLDPDSPKDKARLAVLCGREKAMSYRVIDGQGGLSTPVERLIELVNRLPTDSGRKKRQFLEELAAEAAERQGIRDPFGRGTWRREGPEGTK